jgi:hypothetical protein
MMFLKKFMLNVVKVCYKCKNVAHVIHDNKYYCAKCRLNEQLSNNKNIRKPRHREDNNVIRYTREKKYQKDMILYELDIFLLHVEQ